MAFPTTPHSDDNGTMDSFLESAISAIEEARQGLREGGIPVGSVIVYDGNIASIGGLAGDGVSNPEFTGH
jgi:tRNA(Arg) A34 adenosine deaminase TadA